MHTRIAKGKKKRLQSLYITKTPRRMRSAYAVTTRLSDMGRVVIGGNECKEMLFAHHRRYKEFFQSGHVATKGFRSFGSSYKVHGQE